MVISSVLNKKNHVSLHLSTLQMEKMNAELLIINTIVSQLCMFACACSAQKHKCTSSHTYTGVFCSQHENLGDQQDCLSEQTLARTHHMCRSFPHARCFHD